MRGSGVFFLLLLDSCGAMVSNVGQVVGFPVTFPGSSTPVSLAVSFAFSALEMSVLGASALAISVVFSLEGLSCVFAGTVFSCAVLGASVLGSTAQEKIVPAKTQDKPSSEKIFEIEIGRTHV